MFAIIFLLFLLIISGILIWLIINIYNNLVFRKNQVDKAFSSVDVILKKRCDLIPNLVAVVKNYAKYEQQTLAQVTRLRSQVMTGKVTGNERVRLENQISRTLGNILVLAENYPELKANENFIQLQETINEIEEQISAARRFYNTAVTDYNNALEMFPSNLIATQMNYRSKRLFETSSRDRLNVDVSNLFN